jgi:hypothetical protein
MKFTLDDTYNHRIGNITAATTHSRKEAYLSANSR